MSHYIVVTAVAIYHTLDLKPGKSFINAEIDCDTEDSCMTTTGAVSMTGVVISTPNMDGRIIKFDGEDAELTLIDTTVGITNNGLVLTQNGSYYIDKCTCSAADCNATSTGNSHQTYSSNILVFKLNDCQ